MANDLRCGDIVVIPWGIDEVRATVRETYGPADDLRVVVVLGPELSSYVVDEETTLALRRRDVRLEALTA